MITRMIECTDAAKFNYGRFMVGWFNSEEAGRRELIEGEPGQLLMHRWPRNAFMVLDLVTGEGALFTPIGLVYQLNEKHQVWVCPLFEHFLAWLEQFLKEGGDATVHARLAELPATLELPTGEYALFGHRRTRTAAP